ncbi:MAG TPA: 50S ribosomal protein L11 methyltransferase [Candidatus Saccharimonadia bacterium]|nr:50S ribosomal protein L11 methyltransferase [Candidatus Saccharimonadia bacterium]
MTWLELSIRSHRREWARIEAALEELGALSVTLLDASDAPILEPGPGETPLWPELVANALFDADVDRRGLLAALVELAPAFDPAQATFDVVEDADWSRAWMDTYQPMRFGERLWIYPSTIDPPAAGDEIVVRLDPGLAFGTGTHATTAMCLEWLDALAHGRDATARFAGARVLDYGCGSGVLAIAALKLGAASAAGVDNDPQALLATRDNAERNGVADRLSILDPDDPALAPGSFDVVVANILAGALVALAPRLCALARAGAPVALSGILPAQQAEVIEAYAPWCFALTATERDGWVRVDGTRSG